MDLQKMVDELNLECVFFFFICDPRKDLALKREPQQKILDRFLPVMGVRCYGICDGAISEMRRFFVRGSRRSFPCRRRSF